MPIKPCSRAALSRAVDHAAPHLRPLFLAVRDHGCLIGVAYQGQPLSRIRLDRPTMLLIGDDTDVALGPDGFERDTLTWFVAQCGAALVVSSAAIVEAYAAAASNAAMLREHVAIVETRLEQEQPWWTSSVRLDPASAFWCPP